MKKNTCLTDTGDDSLKKSLLIMLRWCLKAQDACVDEIPDTEGEVDLKKHHEVVYQALNRIELDLMKCLKEVPRTRGN